MGDKTPEPRVRAQRPDAGAIPEVATKLDAQGHTTADNGATTAGTDGVVASPTGGTFGPDSGPEADEEEAPEPIKPEDIPDAGEGGVPHFRPPFTVLGIVLQDSHGRTVATVGAGHMTTEARNKAALWMAGKLNS